MASLYVILGWVLTAAYFAAPLAMAAWVWRKPAERRRFLGTVLVGVLLGISLCAIYGVALGGIPGIGQVLLTAYLAIALLTLLKLGDRGLQRLLLGPSPGTSRRVLGTSGRLLVLALVGLPAVMAAAMTYRVKIVPPVNPAEALGTPYETVRFTAADGTRLAAWWMPALGGESDRTVVLVHGLGGGKADLLPMAAAFLPHGYNVLMPDLRGHGQSGGQVSTFGVRETADVDAAIQWLVNERPAAARDVYGVGVSMGAAAMLAAAADDPRVDAVVAISTYDDLGGMAADATGMVFSWPVDRFARHVAVPLASAHAGADLAGFRPADAAAEFWPRPVMVLHGERDEIIPFARGQRLYDAASHPKRQWWVPGGEHNDVPLNDKATAEIRLFLDQARPVPLI